MSTPGLKADRQEQVLARSCLNPSTRGGRPREQRGSLLDEHASSVGQLDALRVPLEQLHAQLGFERLHRSAQRGLSDEQLATGLGEAQVAGYGQEIPELPKVEVSVRIPKPRVDRPASVLINLAHQPMTKLLPNWGAAYAVS